MGQFIFGLIAGIIVGLVMEWVIDWTGLLPKGSPRKGNAQKAAQSSVAAGRKRAEERTDIEMEPSLPNPDITGE